MVRVHYSEKWYPLPAGATVLDALEQGGADIDSSCRAGLCQRCMLRLESGRVPAKAQKGLSTAKQEGGYFLPCLCHPTEDLVCTPASALNRFSGRIVDKQRLTAQVFRLRLEVPGLDWQAGQYLNLYRDEQISRCYSIASQPGSGVVECHIKQLPGGQLSDWLWQRQVGDELTVSEALGECTYATHIDHHAPLLLAATGTGLAPIYGVLQAAIAAGHKGRIAVYLAAGQPQQLYYREELAQLAAQHSDITLSWVVKSGADASMLTGDLVDCALQGLEGCDMKPLHAFLCGNPDTVKRLQKTLFLRGASLKQIKADAFVSFP